MRPYTSETLARALNIHAAIQPFKKTKQKKQTVTGMSTREDMGQRGEEATGLLCVRGQCGCSGGKRGMELHPPRCTRLTPVFLFVSVRDSSALHLGPNQSAGLYPLPATWADSRSHRGGGGVDSGTGKTRRDLRRHREDNLREDIWIFCHLLAEDVDLQG